MFVVAYLGQSEALGDQPDLQSEKFILGQYTARLHTRAMSGMCTLQQDIQRYEDVKQNLVFGKLRTIARLMRTLQAHRVDTCR